MKSKTTLLLTLVPTAFTLAAILLAVYFYSIELSNQQHRLLKDALIASKMAELRGYVKLARSALPSREQLEGGETDERSGRFADLLSRLDFGTDGYFFLYDDKGRNLMHPRQPDLVGQDLMEMRDPYGGTPIKDLVAASNQGGGFVYYYWNKPSERRTVRKLGYVEPVSPYRWMLGTGLYVDDIEKSIREFDARARANIHGGLLVLLAVSMLCILLISGTGLALNLRNQHRATEALRQLARRVVRSQEDERARVARDLHDGIGQILVSIKWLLETAMATQGRAAGPAAVLPGKLGSTQSFLQRALERLGQALLEIHHISNDLRPAALQDLGLAAALRSMVLAIGEEGGPRVRFSAHGAGGELTPQQGTALFRICQEALTNARRHAAAQRIDVVLLSASRRVILSVRDDGKGFNPQRAHAGGDGGSGLSHMRERMLMLGGTLSIDSTAAGTTVTAVLEPRAAA